MGDVPRDSLIVRPNPGGFARSRTVRVIEYSDQERAGN